MHFGSSPHDRNTYRIQLIGLVKANPMLWDKTSEDFNNRPAKILKWRQVSEELDVSLDKIRRTWENLRDQYRRDLKRSVLYGSKSKWRFFEDMNFIRSMVRIKGSAAGANSDSDSGNEGTPEQTPKDEFGVEHFADLLETGLGSSAATITFEHIDAASVWNEESGPVIEQTYSEAASLVEQTMTVPKPDVHPQPQQQLEAQQQQQRQHQSSSDSSNELKYELNIPELVKIEIGSGPNSPNPIPADNTTGELVIGSNISDAYVATANATAQQQPFGRPRRTRAAAHQQQQQRFDASQYGYGSEYSAAKRYRHAYEHAQHAPVPQDEDYHFVMSILPSLRQIGRQHKLPLRTSIMNLITEQMQREQN